MQVDRQYFIQLLHTSHCPVCTERAPTLLLARHTSNCTRTGEILELYPSQHCERKIESCFPTLAHTSVSYPTKPFLQLEARWVERNPVSKHCILPKDPTQLLWPVLEQEYSALKAPTLRPLKMYISSLIIKQFIPLYRINALMNQGSSLPKCESQVVGKCLTQMKETPYSVSFTTRRYSTIRTLELPCNYIEHCRKRQIPGICVQIPHTILPRRLVLQLCYL